MKRDLRSGNGRFPHPLRRHLVKVSPNTYLCASDPHFYEKMLRYADPSSPEAHCMLGEHCERNGRFDLALHHYTAASVYPSPYYMRAMTGIARVRQRQTEKAAAMRMSALGRFPAWMKLLMAVVLLTAVALAIVSLAKRPNVPLLSAASSPGAADKQVVCGEVPGSANEKNRCRFDCEHREAYAFSKCWKT